jgi:hypothetical protein
MIFHTFNLGDVEDPDIYVASPLFEWQQTEKGQWVMQHGQELTYNINPDMHTLGYKVTIRGCLTPEDEVYYTLKYK